MSNPPPSPLFILRRHTSEITALHFISEKKSSLLVSRNSPALLSGSKTGEIFLWDLKIKRVRYEISGHNGKMIKWLHCFQNSILSQGRDGFINIWSIANNEWSIIRTIPSSEVGFCSAALVATDHSCVLIPNDSCSLKVHDYKSGSIQNELKNQSHGMCMCLKVAQLNGQILVFVGHEDGTVVLWKWDEDKVVSSLHCHAEPVFAIDFDSQLYRKGVSGSAENTLHTWILDDNWVLTKQREIKLANPGVNTVRVRPDGKVLITGGWDGNVRVFSWKTLKPLAILSFHEQSIQCIELFSDIEDDDQSMFAVGSKDSNITLWKIY